MIRCDDKHPEGLILACPDCHRLARQRLEELEAGLPDFKSFATPEEFAELERAAAAFSAHIANAQRELDTLKMFTISMDSRMGKAMQKAVKPSTVEAVQPLLEMNQTRI